MAVKQSEEAGAKKPLPKNQSLPSNEDWMNEFDSAGASDESADAELHTNGAADETFAELFEASQKQQEIKEGEVVDGTVVGVGPDYVTIDIGYKCEGLVPLQEFKDAQGTAHVQVADIVAVYLERMELENGFML